VLGPVRATPCLKKKKDEINGSRTRSLHKDSNKIRNDNYITSLHFYEEYILWQKYDFKNFMIDK